jgi:hypothetical protein
VSPTFFSPALLQRMSTLKSAPKPGAPVLNISLPDFQPECAKFIDYMVVELTSNGCIV